MARLIDRSPVVALVALPAITGAVLYVAVVVTGMAATHPIWTMDARNLSEAAALRDGAAVVRLAEHGQDMNRAREVRANLMLDETAMLTPIEAAAAGRDETIVQLLFDLGAAPDAAGWQRAFCISDADSVRKVLRAHQPPGVVEDCAEQ
jgi:hypothetical protein